MAGWDHEKIGQAEKHELVRLLPVSAVSNVLVAESKTVIVCRRASLYKDNIHGCVVTVDKIDKSVHLVKDVIWDYDENTRLVARYVEPDNYPDGRIAVAQIQGSNIGLSNHPCEEVTNTRIVQAVQLLFDIIYPKK